MCDPVAISAAERNLDNLSILSPMDVDCVVAGHLGTEVGEAGEIGRFG